MSDTQGTLDLMKEAGVKVTRESFIEVAYLGTPPDPWTALDEGELPDELQDFSLFTIKGAELVYNGPPLGGATAKSDPAKPGAVKPTAAAGSSGQPTSTGKVNA